MKPVPPSSKTLYGIERETLRVTPEGAISSTPHPHALGHPLTSPTITLDFAEMQLELVTPPFETIKKARAHLASLIGFCQHNIGTELLWPLSMPARLPKRCLVADFGDTLQGKEKTLYRKGLVHRYGQNMQLISGIHLNISFDDLFWTQAGVERSEGYMHIVRNYLRYGWLLTYLFGASPSCDKTYGINPSRYPHATSLRTSTHGYYSRIQQQHAMSFSSVSSFIKKMEALLGKTSPKYKSIKEQISPAILQLEGEWYSRIRPKRSIDDMKEHGVSYLEIRSIDIDPFDPVGISERQIRFTEAFLQMCLSLPSPPLSKQEQLELCRNQNDVALYGRSFNLKLKRKGKTISFESWAHELIDAVALIYPQAELYHSHITDKEKTPSGKLVALMKEKKHDHINMGLHFANAKQKQTNAETHKRTAQASHIEAKRRKIAEIIYYPEYSDMQLSTQALFRECDRQGISYTILDRNEHIVELRKNKKKEIVAQATMTRLDPYNVVQLMGSKHATKYVLENANLSVPKGGLIRSPEEGLSFIADHTLCDIVIKPNTTNYGEGVHLLRRSENPKKALTDALRYDTEVIIEQWIHGEEFRLLVIDGKCCGVIKREGANVIGDGKHTIKELVKQKNTDPLHFRPQKEQLKLSAYERRILKGQGLTSASIPSKGKKIFLRDNTNVSTGGDAIDCTDEIHSYYKQLAVKATHILGANICGIDMIVSAPRKKDGKYAIIEANYNPMIASHIKPYRGKTRNIAAILLKALGF